MEVSSKRITTKYRLKRLFTSHWGERAVPSMHWFRKAPAWYHLSFSYNNPYNVASVHSELFALHQRIGRISDLMANRALVFLGTGVGDTEMFITERILEKEEEIELVAIDVNNDFLDDFENSLRNKQLEHKEYQIKLQRVHGIFEDVQRETLLYGMPGKRAYVCLGNTVGNYRKTQEFIEILRRLSDRGDVILLGFQLDTYLEELFNKYSTNPLFEEFIKGYIPRGKSGEIKWELDADNSAISAYIGDVQVFFSKKFKEAELREAMEECGFKILFEESNTAENVCIQLSRRT